MAVPCSKCGATKTEPVFESMHFRYKLARVFGYELRQCGRCRRLRLLEPHSRHRQTDSTGKESASGDTASTALNTRHSPVGGEMAHADETDDLARCPRCGSTRCHRSRRRAIERLVRRFPMARCEACRHRFPLH
jgi:hypothetical protein